MPLVLNILLSKKTLVQYKQTEKDEINGVNRNAFGIFIECKNRPE